MKPRRVRTCRMYLVLLLSSLVASCNEEFPPYEAPADVLQARISLECPDTVDVYWDSFSHQYSLNSTMVLKVEVTNVHDDLLQGKARVGGRIRVQSFAQIPRVLLVELTNGNLRTPPLFQGNIALGPGKKAEFSELWLPYATDKQIVFEGLSYVEQGARRIYPPIFFIATADVQLFERVQPVRSSETAFAIVFRVISL